MNEFMKKWKKKLAEAGKKNIIIAMAVGVMAVLGGCGTQAMQTAEHSIEEKELPLYIAYADGCSDMPVCFIDGGDIPYMSLDDWIEVMRVLYHLELGEEDYDLTLETDGDKAVYRRENGSDYTMDFDFAKDEIHFLDYNAFLRGDDELYLLDLQSSSRAYGEYIKCGEGSNERYGDELTMELAPYGIDLIRQGEEYYAPIQTLADIMTTPMLCPMLYNGEALFLIADEVLGNTQDGLTEMGELYYSAPTGERSEELGIFSYNELCFALDNLYGLKETHDIDSFDDLFYDIGLQNVLKGTDAYKADRALYQMIYEDLDDGHSVYRNPSYLTGSDADFSEEFGQGLARTRIAERREQLCQVRDQYYPDGVPGYEEVGNTAYITFDSFNSGIVDYYETAPDADAEDTIGLIAYSCSQILREDSPIENVVLDLSCNRGGEGSAAAYVLGAFMDHASISMKDMLTGALVTNVYEVDTNLDHVFDERDTLAGKGLGLYCLTSQVSFSCGNLVPCVFKDSGEVHILGQKSAGGSCVVQPMTTARGSVFRVSGRQRLSFLKNGAFYDVDRGAEPDYYISNIDNFYDRAALTEYINGLF